jgi:hypothetical protein
MTFQDREQFRAFAARQTQLEQAVARLREDFQVWQAQTEIVDYPENWIPEAPPIPVAPPPLPPMRPATFAPKSEAALPEIPAAPSAPPSATETLTEPPRIPEVEEEKQGELEFQFGRWLARIGVVFALITMISFSTVAYKDLYQYMGPWSKLGVLALVSIGLLVTGLRIERKNSKLTIYGRTLAGGGLACLYYTLYGATYVEQLQVIHSPLFGGFLLLAWSAYVLYLAEKKKSELLSIFAIALAYFSSAITPVGDFTMAANLILSLTAVIFLVRNAWTGLSYLCLVGTYVGLLRQVVVYDSSNYFLFEMVRGISFWPAATYLVGAWVIYTAGVFLAATPSFAAGKRMAFLCLNNGAVIGLLTMVSYLSNFGHVGAILCVTGGVFMVTSFLARRLRADAADVSGAYLMQGLALATGGLVIAYTGVTRGLLITVESVFLAAAGAFARNIIFRIAGYVSALLGTGFLLAEIHPGAAHPWVLIVGGSVAMLANAWLARRELWGASREIEVQRIVPGAAFYVLLASALISCGIESQLSDVTAAPVMALTTLALTFSVYVVPLIELPLVIQIVLLFAARMVIFPLDDSHSWQSEVLVGLPTMILAAWWPRQKLIPTGWWLQPVLALYSAAIVGMVYCAVHPHFGAQGWMIAASLLSLIFLAYGASTRLWQFMISGQVYLVLAVVTFYQPWTDATKSWWDWWAAAIPIGVVFFTGWLAHERLSRYLRLSESVGQWLSIIAYCYQTLALAMAVTWIGEVVPHDEMTFAFFLLATALLLWNTRWPSGFGVRAGLIVSLIGSANYVVTEIYPGITAFTGVDAAAFALFLAQPAILRRWGRELLFQWEGWTVILISSGMAWYFVSNVIEASGSDKLTLGWALFALGLTVIGFAANERRQRWCGLAILLASIIRVAVYDFWSFSDLGKVLTFFVLTVICLGLSFLYYKFASRLKDWL